MDNKKIATILFGSITIAILSLLVYALDPSIFTQILDYSTDTDNTNVRIEANFSHIEINSIDPYTNLISYYPFDKDDESMPGHTCPLQHGYEALFL